MDKLYLPYAISNLLYASLFKFFCFFVVGYFTTVLAEFVQQ